MSNAITYFPLAFITPNDLVYKIPLFILYLSNIILSYSFNNPLMILVVLLIKASSTIMISIFTKY